MSLSLWQQTVKLKLRLFPKLFLLTHYPTHPKTLELLRDRAENDPNEQLREWAEEQLAERGIGGAISRHGNLKLTQARY